MSNRPLDDVEIDIINEIKEQERKSAFLLRKINKMRQEQARTQAIIDVLKEKQKAIKAAL